MSARDELMDSLVWVEKYHDGAEGAEERAQRLADAYAAEVRAAAFREAADVADSVRNFHYGPGEFKAEKIAVSRVVCELRRMAGGE